VFYQKTKFLISKSRNFYPPWNTKTISPLQQILRTLPQQKRENKLFKKGSQAFWKSVLTDSCHRTRNRVGVLKSAKVIWPTPSLNSRQGCPLPQETNKPPSLCRSRSLWVCPRPLENIQWGNQESLAAPEIVSLWVKLLITNRFKAYAKILYLPNLPSSKSSTPLLESPKRRCHRAQSNRPTRTRSSSCWRSTSENVWSKIQFENWTRL
jgi:hypothetical protein